MEKQIFNILYKLNNIKYLDNKDKKIYISFYNFFINNYKKYNNVNDLFNIYLIYNGKESLNETLNFFDKILNINITLDKIFIVNEIKRYENIKNSNIKNNIIYFHNKNSNVIDGKFLVYSKWFDNYLIIKNLSNNKILKLYVQDNILKYININDIINLKIIKNNKSFWSIINIIDFLPNGLRNDTYKEIY